VSSCLRPPILHCPVVYFYPLILFPPQTIDEPGSSLHSLYFLGPVLDPCAHEDSGSRQKVSKRFLHATHSSVVRPIPPYNTGSLLYLRMCYLTSCPVPPPKQLLDPNLWRIFPNQNETVPPPPHPPPPPAKKKKCPATPKDSIPSFTPQPTFIEFNPPYLSNPNPWRSKGPRSASPSPNLPVEISFAC